MANYSRLVTRSNTIRPDASFTESTVALTELLMQPNPVLDRIAPRLRNPAQQWGLNMKIHRYHYLVVPAQRFLGSLPPQTQMLLVVAKLALIILLVGFASNQI
jgi:hypothetical protein